MLGHLAQGLPQGPHLGRGNQEWGGQQGPGGTRREEKVARLHGMARRERRRSQRRCPWFGAEPEGVLGRRARRCQAAAQHGAGRRTWPGQRGGGRAGQNLVKEQGASFLGHAWVACTWALGQAACQRREGGSTGRQCSSKSRRWRLIRRLRGPCGDRQQTNVGLSHVWCGVCWNRPR